MRKIKELEEKLEIKDRIIKQIAEDFFIMDVKKFIISAIMNLTMIHVNL